VTAVPYSPQTPYGSLTKINLVTVQAPCKITLQSGPATLAELVGNTGASINYAGLQDVTTGKAASGGTSFTRALGKAVTCSGGGSASLSGSLSFGITPTLHASFSLFGGLSSASFAVTVSASASLRADVQTSAGCNLNNFRIVAPFDIATFKGTIGGWPIVVTLRGLVDANASLSAGAQTTAGITAKESVTGGVGYGNPSGSCAGHASGGFYPIYCGPTSDPFTFTPPAVTATDSATATISPTLQALLYGVAGPQVRLTTGVDFSADTTKNPWWTLTAPLNIDGSLVAPILGLSKGSLSLHHSSFPIANAGGPFTGSATVTVTNPGTQTASAGSPVNLQIQASDTDGGALSYTAAGLPAGLSINPSSGQITGTPTTAAASTVTVSATDTTGPSGHATFGWTVSPGTNATAGTVWAWGLNNSGDLGQGNTGGFGDCTNPSCNATPQPVIDVSNVKAIAGESDGGGGYALLNGGTVWAWGLDFSGELGDGTASGVGPVQVSNLSNVIAIAGASADGYALKSDGTVWAWGYNADGELGNGNTGTNSAIPVEVSGLSQVIAIASGYGAAYVLKSDGTVWAWGLNRYGEIGNGTTGGHSDLPVQVSGLTGVTAIAGSPSQSGYALKSDGTAWAWGNNSSGQLGDGQEAQTGMPADSNVPVQIMGLANVTAIAGGGGTAYAVTSGGAAWAWGTNGSGQLGTGASGSDVLVPSRITSLSNVAAVAGGNDGGYALESNGTVWSWGSNGYGQLGTGTRGSERDVPVEAVLPPNVSAISATSHSAYALIGP
jgi:alpha-tubulin suppressor-like RCC1 family protein